MITAQMIVGENIHASAYKQVVGVMDALEAQRTTMEDVEDQVFCGLIGVNS